MYMNQFWVSLIIQNEGDKRAWLSPMSESVSSLEAAMKTIERSRQNYNVLSAWVDVFDTDNVKHTVFHECYVDPLGYVR